MSLFIYCHAECHYAECRYTECHYAEYRGASQYKHQKQYCIFIAMQSCYTECYLSGCRHSGCRYAECCVACEMAEKILPQFHP
jgi:hypothetical protein